MIKTKTNKQWYPYEEEFGCYFKLDNGELLGCAISDNGTPDEEDAYNVIVDNKIEPEDTPRLKAIVKELEEKE
jgi:hypothetical protein